MDAETGPRCHNLLCAPDAMPAGALLRRSCLLPSTPSNDRVWGAHKAAPGKLAAFEVSKCLLWSGHSQWGVGQFSAACHKVRCHSGATDLDWAAILAQCYPSASCAL